MVERSSPGAELCRHIAFIRVVECIFDFLLQLHTAATLPETLKADSCQKRAVCFQWPQRRSVSGELSRVAV